MSIKESAETWVRGAPSQALVLVAAVGIVLGGVAGLGAGFKIEQSRTRSDVKRLRVQLAQAGSGATPSPSTALGQRIGKITATSAGSITVTTKRQGSQELRTTSTTQFEQAVKGSKADIVVGHRVLVTVAGDSVIVLPDTSRLGRAVTNVGSDSFTIAKTNNAKAGTVPMTSVKVVDTVTTSKPAEFKIGDQVLSGGRTASGKNAFDAVEVILLPAGSGFAS